MLKPIRLHLCLPSLFDYAYGSGVVLTNPSCSNSSLSLCFDYGDTMPITGYDVSKQRADAVHLRRKDLLLRPDMPNLS